MILSRIFTRLIRPKTQPSGNVMINGVWYNVPISWARVHWSLFDQLCDPGLSVDKSVALACGSDDPLLVNPMVVEMLRWLEQPPLPAVLDTPVIKMPLECYINGRQAYRNDPKDYYGLVRCYWPVCPDDADTVISRYKAIREAWDELETQFPILHTKPTHRESKAGAEALSAFYEYGMIYQMGGANILNEDEVLKKATIHVFMHRAYGLTLSQYEAKLIAKK